MTHPSGPPGIIEHRMRVACYLALVALGLIVWSLVDPAPLPVIGAMSVGQVIGTASFVFFLFAVVADLRPALVMVREQARKTADTAKAAADPLSTKE
jgi:hypothetical protein